MSQEEINLEELLQSLKEARVQDKEYIKELEELTFEDTPRVKEVIEEWIERLKEREKGRKSAVHFVVKEANLIEKLTYLQGTLKVSDLHTLNNFINELVKGKNISQAPIMKIKIEED